MFAGVAQMREEVLMVCVVGIGRTGREVVCLELDLAFVGMQCCTA